MTLGPSESISLRNTAQFSTRSWKRRTEVEDLDLITDELYDEWGVPYRLKVPPGCC